MILLTVMTCFPLFARAQGVKLCCYNDAAAQFSAFALERNFIRAHDQPTPFTFSAENGAFVTFRTPDDSVGRAFELRSPVPTDKVVLMIHEWWGLNDYIQREAERLQRELGDVTFLALDLYDGRIASTPEEAGKLMAEVKTERATAIIKGAIEYAGRKTRFGTIGWCFGGGWSLQTALLGGKQTAACVMYYGMPEFESERLKNLKAPVLGIFAKQDNWITPEKVKEFEKVMKQAKKKLTVRMYDAVHAFANPSNPNFNRKAAADAHKHVVEFFRRHL